jgi:hypothetical protein
MQVQEGGSQAGSWSSSKQLHRRLDSNCRGPGTASGKPRVQAARVQSNNHCKYGPTLNLCEPAQQLTTVASPWLSKPASMPQVWRRPS